MYIYLKLHKQFGIMSCHVLTNAVRTAPCRRNVTQFKLKSPAPAKVCIIQLCITGAEKNLAKQTPVGASSLIAPPESPSLLFTQGAS